MISYMEENRDFMLDRRNKMDWDQRFNAEARMRAMRAKKGEERT
jgi:hypothetical protein